jgi:hypothetical protein
MRLLDFLVTVLLPLIIQPTAACEDERQFVRHGGQEWTTLKRLAADHHNRLEEEAPRLLGIGTEPEFAIGQRALLLQSDGGNLFWDCITLLDGQTAAERFLRGSPHRRQDRDCHDQAKTISDAMHNLFFRQLSSCEDDDF